MPAMSLFSRLNAALLCICFSLFFTISLSSPTPDPDHDHVDKRASFFAITGAPGNQQRLEIRQMQKNQPQFNLYVLALRQFQLKPQNQLTSYYQISGIHGRPFTTWDSVSFAPGRGGGYCTHDIGIFPTWHRPYIALYEQVLYNEVQDIARDPVFRNHPEYQSAASSFRVPYWDWAAPAQGGKILPPSIGGSAFMVLPLPNGTTTVKNPLYQYNFHPVNRNDIPDAPFSGWGNTLRYPNGRGASASSQNAAVGQQLLQSQGSYSQRFMNLLQAYPTYDHFSNEGWIPQQPGSYDSLESLHDQLHGLIGNGGHMGIIDYSAFDPVFWLHHVNVDRLFAIWQALHPKSYVGATKAGFGTATIRPGDTLDANTPLKPFHKTSSGAFWTSAQARSTSTFGYTYPETANSNIASVKAAVNKLYSATSGKHIKLKRGMSVSGGHGAASANKTDSPVAELVAAGISSSAAAKALPKEKSASALSEGNGYYKEWITNIRVAKDALQTAFFIHVFVGDFNPDPKSWSFEPNLVGTHTIFTPYAQVAQLDKNNPAITTGTIPLTRALRLAEEKGEVDVNDEKCVEDYLRKNLHWRVTRMDDTCVPTNEIPELKISVVSSCVTPAQADDEFPSWGTFTVHQPITQGRPGGLCQGEPA